MRLYEKRIFFNVIIVSLSHFFPIKKEEKEMQKKEYNYILFDIRRRTISIFAFFLV